MSFAGEVKTELCSVRTSRCCSFAECYGILLFAKRFSSAAICVQTENIEVAELFCKLCSECFDARTKISSGGIKKEVFVVNVVSPSDRKKIMIHYGCNDGKRPERINTDIFKKQCCRSAFLRGVFISSGSVSDPNKTNYVRFTVKDLLLANDLYNILSRIGIEPKSFISNNTATLYYKESQLIEDLFITINATKNTLAFMNVGVMKTVKNKLNRQENCMMANLDKTVEASVRQRTAIMTLKSTGAFDMLDDSLKYAAKLRTDNPESSLSELCRISDKPISKAALNRKLSKLCELAEKQKGEE